MDAFQLIAERRIAEAMERGDFKDLAGQGKRLPPDPDPGVPVALHMAYKILKNAGCLPPEVVLRKEIEALTEALQNCGTCKAYEECLACPKRETCQKTVVSDDANRRREYLLRIRDLLEKLSRIRKQRPAELETHEFNAILDRLRPHHTS